MVYEVDPQRNVFDVVDEVVPETLRESGMDPLGIGCRVLAPIAEEDATHLASDPPHA